MQMQSNSHRYVKWYRSKKKLVRLLNLMLHKGQRADLPIYPYVARLRLLTVTQIGCVV